MPEFDVQSCIFGLEPAQPKVVDLNLTVSTGADFQKVEEGYSHLSYQRENNGIIILSKVCGRYLPRSQSRSDGDGLYNRQSGCGSIKVRHSGLIVGTTLDCTAAARHLLCGCRCRYRWRDHGRELREGILPNVQCGSTKFHVAQKGGRKSNCRFVCTCNGFKGCAGARRG